MQLPYWFYVSQILIAAAVAVIGWAQWHTASLRVGLDLFDRRRHIFDSASDLMKHVIGSGQVSHDTAREMTDLWRQSRFLFGAEMSSALESVVVAMWDIETSNAELDGLDDSPERAAEVKKRRDALSRIEFVQKRLPSLAGRYLCMDMKIVRSPWRWLRDLRERRTK